MQSGKIFGLTATALVLTALCTGPSNGATEGYPKLVAVPGGTVSISDSVDQSLYDEYKFAPARRAGDYVYVSGVVVRSRREGPKTADTFKAEARVAFMRLRDRLKGLNADFSDVVMINTYHDWSAAEFVGDRLAQFKAFCEVKDESMPNLYPAWTAVGTSGLIVADGVVEIQMIAYTPRRK